MSHWSPAVDQPGDSTRSSFLGATYSLLRLWSGEETASHALETLGVSVHLSVLDTNILMRDIKYRLQHGHITSFIAAARLGSLRLVASVTVRDEVPEHLGEVVTKYGLSVEDALRIWEQEYVPQMVFVDPAELPLSSPRVLALADRDADDVPTALLVEWFKPESTFSDDKDLAAFGAIGKDTAVLACAYYALAKRDSMIAGAPVGTMMVLNIGIPVLEASWRVLRWGVARLDRRWQWGLLGIAVLLLLWGLAQPRFRNWLAERADDVRSAVKQGIEEVQRIEQAAAEARETLNRSQPVPAPPRTARGYVAYVLARAPGPLSVATITRRMRKQGYHPRSAHPEQYVARLLRTHPRLFERVGRRRWQLRSHQYSSANSPQPEMSAIKR
ncbi:MAG TPA: hypothetical protein VFV38_32320 [Ktedonobacteraceae bacterium]|nr:hypothetical protein [Ktedonobacteraceae bacterium]